MMTEGTSKSNLNPFVNLTIRYLLKCSQDEEFKDLRIVEQFHASLSLTSDLGVHWTSPTRKYCPEFSIFFGSSIVANS